ncbi:hypothetical protein [Clostridium ganghwense]|uniref:Lipoprotein n=1 Tax=Clostridium ganghwense TaxID=312089 RepID=A0ABT4CLY2_9CLOT|nr:hypothetical protein [Clostridium ganghwense]MCY6370047.1 hypothetical protein [Clostridium ganghwense]
MKKVYQKLWICVSVIALSFTLIACTKIKDKASVISEKTLNKVTSQFISEIPYFKEEKGKIFCSYEVLGISEKSNEVTQYLDVLAQEYYIENGELKEGTTGAYPVVITIKREGKDYNVQSYKLSKELEKTDAIKILPKSIQKKVLSDEYKNSQNDRTKKGTLQRIEKAKKYFEID